MAIWQFEEVKYAIDVGSPKTVAVRIYNLEVIGQQEKDLMKNENRLWPLVE